ncbi:hypothetical protein CHS0354_013508 [Potamilus streckersoni]|uniref:Alpha-type protein kinase domain-containing protein n=1 Tax=Potamilus streckersoni TaxID=2493646 RepID=A0AAE0W879_9BIVA|nr:hypothetical protein CHS0354_013508 [Potamilus streckersoni]
MAVSPTLRLKKAEILKTSGDLHGAMKMLEDISSNSGSPPWQYADENEYRHIQAKCLQLKGTIMHKLCCWKDAVIPLKDSMKIFKELPDPDVIGILSSSDVICRCLMKLTLADYLDIRECCQFLSDHHCKQAHDLAIDSARLSEYHGFHILVSRNYNIAAESLLMFLADCGQRIIDQNKLSQVLCLLRESLSVYTLQRQLENQEFVYEMVRSVFLGFLTLNCSHVASDRSFALRLQQLSISLYKPYCNRIHVLTTESTNENGTDETACCLNEALNIYCLKPIGRIFIPKTTSVKGNSDMVCNFHSELGLPVNPDKYSIPHIDVPCEVFREALGCSYNPKDMQMEPARKPLTFSDCNEGTTCFGLVDTNTSTLCIDCSHVHYENESLQKFPKKQTDINFNHTCTVPKYGRSLHLEVVNGSCSTQNSRLNSANSDLEIVGNTNSKSILQLRNGSKNSESFQNKANLSILMCNPVLHLKVEGHSFKLSARSSTSYESCYKKDSKKKLSIENDSGVGISADASSVESVKDIKHRVQPYIMKTSVVKKMAVLPTQMKPAVSPARLMKYNPVTGLWTAQQTLAYFGPKLTLECNKKGNCRDAFFVQYIHQDETLGRYVGKRYRNQKQPEQYMKDVICHKTARFLVTVFNYALQNFDIDVHVQYVPVAHLQILSHKGDLEDWINVEPYIEGEFTKLTNNLTYCNPRAQKLATALTHFSHHISKGKLMLVDLQGWLPDTGSNVIYLTDPQFHSKLGSGSRICSGDFGEEGMKAFWDKVHPQCNEICLTLNLKRP